MRRNMVAKQSLLKIIDEQKTKNQEVIDQVINLQLALLKNRLLSQNSDANYYFQLLLKKTDILNYYFFI